MATTIKLKNSVTTTNAPSSLVQGEVAINITDKKVWVGNAATTPIQLLGAGSSASFGALTCTSLTNSGLTSGRVTYASTGGLLADSANFTFNGTTVTMANDASISGLTVGKGGGSYSENTAFGVTALAVTTGNSNTAIGDRALLVNTSGNENTGVGSAVLMTNTTGTTNTAMGRLAMFSNTTGSSNIGIGHSSLYANTTGGSNTALGMYALQANTTASNNTAVGYQAGYSNTTGFWLAGLGYQSLYANTTGDSLSAVGYRALYNNTTGYQNSALGTQALQSNTTGYANTAVGGGALQANTTANNNTAVGYQALYSNTTNSGNSALGAQALYSTTTGGVNTAFGQQAGYSNTTGNYSTFLGYQAGYSATTGGSNTFVGRNAGYNVSTGAKNTILGSYDGNQGGLDIRTASNYIVLSDGDGNPRGIFDASGNFLIGTTSNPDGIRLAVKSTVESHDFYRATSTGGSASVGYWMSDVNGTKTAVAYIRTNGGLSNYSANDTNLSDERIKTDIKLADSYLDKICAIPVRTFKYKNVENAEDNLGVIAQEVEAVAPELISNDGFGETPVDGVPLKSIYQTDLQYALMKCIQELKAEVDSLKAQLNK